MRIFACIYILIPAALTLGPVASAAQDTPSEVAESTAKVPAKTTKATGASSGKTAKKQVSKSKKHKKKRKRRRGCRAYATPQYKKMVRNWRKTPQIPKPRWRDGYRDLTLYSVNHGERVRVFPFLPDGTLDPQAMGEIEHLFRDKHTGKAHEMNPRLVKVLYRLAVRFEARQINIISGFRESKVGGSESHHSDGSAVDFMIPGVKLPATAKVARRLGHVGVGFYPTSGFVHLDVRERSYFWADRSGPGQPGCLRQIMPKSVWTFDSRHKTAHDEPVPKKNKKGQLLGATPEPTEEATEDEPKSQ